MTDAKIRKFSVVGFFRRSTKLRTLAPTDSFSAALAQNPDETFLLRDGVYRLPTTLRIDGSPTFRSRRRFRPNVELRCDADATLEIDGGSPTFQKVAIRCGAPTVRYCQIQDVQRGISVEDAAKGEFVEVSVHETDEGVFVDGDAEPKFSDCSIYNNRVGVKVRESGRAFFTNCDVSENSATDFEIIDADAPPTEKRPNE